MGGGGRTYLVEGAQLNREKLTENIERSIMMVTALSPMIGYDRAARIAHRALDENLTLQQAALKSGITESLFDRIIDPERLTHPDTANGH
ncbi:hypothetical protein [Sphaerisporangium corydalis]|uniref:Fumarase C C-terminal domain-containing protein n=1 Tax=Sphaerisporangium corydalis TaxID=1441875 RepID=A0ABV9ENF4_9ACTN|nr:hypothetical protein [Sphaerisporangium corydalis]